ncbi:hypothetical protein KP509_01G011900 [Ceratopteris richardii]|uniref:Secreted protein n=1 Tax=Ceratopteris richardii TaxID=49495 RepID=A0A8T2VE57_CERRI|nr:hypothetical protein KP509_01G011900 [Ceratopteris richardii]
MKLHALLCCAPFLTITINLQGGATDYVGRRLRARTLQLLHTSIGVLMYRLNHKRGLIYWIEHSPTNQKETST